VKVSQIPGFQALPKGGSLREIARTPLRTCMKLHAEVSCSIKLAARAASG
jgi:hypothetical protein